MSSSLYQLGRWAYRSRRLVVAAWLVVLVVVGGFGVLVNKGLDDEVTIPGTESQAALTRLASTFPQVSGATAQVVVVAPDGADVEDAAVREPVERAVERLGQVGQVNTVVSPYGETVTGAINEDASAALVSVMLDGSSQTITDDTRDELAQVTADLAEALPDGAQASLGGQLFSAEFPGVTVTEGLGVVFALIVLVITLGSFAAAGMPLINALVGVGAALALVFAATSVMPINSTTPLLALMLGLAVGIDYALFIISRHRDQLRDGLDVEESVARAVATAGSAVVFAGLTVMIALVGLGVAGIPFLTTMGVAAAVAVGITVLVSLTLMPALLGFAGERLRPRPSRRASRADRADRAEHAVEVEGAEHHNRFFSGWIRTVTRFPAVTIGVVVVALGLLTLPAMNLRLALPDAGALPEEASARVTYDLVSEHFGPGANGPLIVTGSIVTSTDPVGLMNDLADEIAELDGVAQIALATPNASADTGIIQVVPEGSPESVETSELVHEIRALHDHFLEEYGVDLSVTGFTAVGIDVSEKLGAALLPFALVVVGLSLLLLTMVFRSVWVPVKATVGYLLSVGAALGVVTLVFEDGVAADLLHVVRQGPVISFMPIVVMGILFGLAMDYEVFLVSRIREDYVHSGDARRAVTTGFLGSAKVVTAAAVIMCGVFIAFVPEGDSNIKPIALALAVGVFVDAFVVRMVFVPAVLMLLGDKAWWMPRWLDRLLPSFDVEGEGLRAELELADWPEPGSTDVIAAQGLTLDGPAGGDPLCQDVSFRMPQGTVLLVEGDDPAATSALLLMLAGRIAPSAGLLKVCGLALPIRSGSVRSRVGYVNLRSEPLDAVRSALDERPRLLVLDGAEAVTDPAVRDRLRQVLAARRPSVALALGTTALRADDLLPTDAEVLVLGATAPPPSPASGAARTLGEAHR
ncbi:MMPL family transporter [Cellulomonas chengniuliangii]|uniref:MMPL family transporter n=1 Tax=Cellulomonas chengniuliangii TaxID=2968084 RepID=UPI001D0EED71|nr:MMPL family transporter [Cellulomonas chengniuliangii]MCC2318649.1 MMPL family transporter [Cellulomonas chengniuliangii]